MSQLICQDLALGYAGKAIVRNLNFRINAGDYFCIVGENGSGKSTLMRTLLHLQPPVSGSILTGDGLKTNEIGYLPQQTLVQRDFPASVREIALTYATHILHMGEKIFLGTKQEYLESDIGRRFTMPEGGEMQ